MPLLSLSELDKSLKLNQIICNQLANPLLGLNLNNLTSASNSTLLQLNSLLTADALLSNAAAVATKQTNTYSRYKTELCRQYSENGQCKYGDKCQFAHGFAELKDVKRHPKYKTDFCKTFYSKGFCPYGPRCHFIHDLSENVPQVGSGIPTCKKLDLNENTPVRTRSSVSSTSSNCSSSNESSSSSFNFTFYTEADVSPQAAPPSTNNVLDFNSLLNGLGSLEQAQQQQQSQQVNFAHRIIW